MPRRKQTGRYPDWLARAMIKAGVVLHHVPQGRYHRRHPSEANLRIAKARMERARLMAEVHAARAQARALLIIQRRDP
jgi:hypothetical protein